MCFVFHSRADKVKCTVERVSNALCSWSLSRSTRGWRWWTCWPSPRSWMPKVTNWYVFLYSILFPSSSGPSKNNPMGKSRNPRRIISHAYKTTVPFILLTVSNLCFNGCSYRENPKGVEVGIGFLIILLFFFFPLLAPLQPPRLQTRLAQEKAALFFALPSRAPGPAQAPHSFWKVLKGLGVGPEGLCWM